jgi:catechol 2,3-dioxygenase-like lactoylglutathione lyase family enzyme
VHIELAALMVDDYDAAVEFFVRALGFDLVEDSPSLTNDGRPKRWVVVRPPGAATGLLPAKADGRAQTVPLAISSPAGPASCSAWMISTTPSGAWRRQAWSSSPSRG